MPSSRNVCSSLLSSSRPTRRPGVALLVNSWRAQLYTVGILLGVDGVRGVCGVIGLPTDFTRRRGVLGTRFDGASRCRGVSGVGSCTTVSYSAGHVNYQAVQTGAGHTRTIVGFSLIISLSWRERDSLTDGGALDWERAG